MYTEESLTNEVYKDGVYLIVRSLKNPDKSNKGHQLGNLKVIQKLAKELNLEGWNTLLQK